MVRIKRVEWRGLFGPDRTTTGRPHARAQNEVVSLNGLVPLFAAWSAAIATGKQAPLPRLIVQALNRKANEFESGRILIDWTVLISLDIGGSFFWLISLHCRSSAFHLISFNKPKLICYKMKRYRCNEIFISHAISIGKMKASKAPHA